MADTYHLRHHGPHRGAEHRRILTALLGGLVAILLLVALVAGVTGAVLYALVLVLTSLFG